MFKWDKSNCLCAKNDNKNLKYFVAEIYYDYIFRLTLWQIKLLERTIG